jgi:hypothetical protein
MSESWEAHGETLNGNGEPVFMPHAGHGFREIAEFPNYVINREGVVANKQTFRILKTERGRQSQSAMLRKDGRAYGRSIRGLLKATFPEDYSD